jgi:hypothetical protein
MPSQQASKAKKGEPFVAKSSRGDYFTKSEEKLLMDAYDDILDLDEDKIIDAWFAWAVEVSLQKFIPLRTCMLILKQNPSHTAQEWRNHFTKQIVPRMEQKAQKSEGEEKKVKVEVKIEDPELPAILHRSSASRPKTAPSNQAQPRVTEIKDSQGSSGKTLDSQNAPKSNPDPTLVDERLFEAKMRELADKLDLELDLIPVICGKRLALFRLWQVVMSDKFGGFDEVNGRGLWPRVAKALDFNDFKHKGAAQDLRDCYSELLIDFEELRDAYREENPDLTDSQEADTSQLIENQLMRTAARETQNVELELIIAAQDDFHREQQKFQLELDKAAEEGYEREEEWRRDQQNFESELDKAAEEAYEREEEYHRDEDNFQKKFRLELLNAENEEDEDEDDDLDQPTSSAPRHISTPSGKRSFNTDRASNGKSYNKRQRIDKGKGKEVEIPSTPEEVLNGNQVPRRPHGPSPLKPPAALETEMNLISDEDDASSNLLFVGSSHQPGLSRPPSKPQRHLEPETQDFHFPPPEPGQPNTYISLSSSPTPQSKPPPRPRVASAEESTQSQTESERKADELQAFFDRFIALGYQDDIIVEALEATTMETGEAPHVMEHLTQGHGIPEDVEGVWTSWDDDALATGEGSVEFERVVRKHGLRRVGLRRRFLEDAREVEGGG